MKTAHAANASVSPGNRASSAFFMLTDVSVPGTAEYMNAFEEDERQMQPFFAAVKSFCERPLPITLDDILEAEAWLLATKWKPA